MNRLYYFLIFYKFFYYLHVKDHSSFSYLAVSFREVGRANVRKNALFVLQTYAVCRNLRTGVAAEYLASNMYIIDASQSSKLNSFHESLI